MLFHVSPIARCASIAKIAGWLSVPTVVKTAIDENARNSAMELQMMGNARGGGIQLGRLRSAIAFFSSAVFGRAALSGEKVRDRNALNRNQTNTIAFL
jgi:hypothetical protein